MDLKAMSWDLGNAQHPGDRPNQQDAFGFSDSTDETFASHGGIAAVLADGMGGLEHGARASRTAVGAFLASYRQKRIDESIADALQRSLTASHDAVRAATNGSGTTLLAAVVHGSLLHWISAGDSGLFLFRRGQLELLTNAHVYARALEMSVASGDIGVDEALSHPERDCLTSYVGMDGLPEMDFSREPYLLQRGDRVLLASDGVYKVLDYEGITSAMIGTAQECCERLLGKVLAMRSPSQDNITALIVAPNIITGKEESKQTREITRQIEKPRVGVFDKLLAWARRTK